MVVNFGTLGQIQLILVSLDQKLSELTSKTFYFSKKVKRLASESTPVEQGQDFATFTGTLNVRRNL